MISVSNLGKAFGADTLFERVAVQLNPGCRYGLVGANGSGKSTFLKILAGEETASEGTVAIAKRLRLGVLRQDHFRFEQERILDVAMMGHRELWEALVAREQLLEEPEFDAERYAALEELILHHDGYSLDARAGEILEGLGVPTAVHRQPLATLSGGFRLRVLLAQVLAGSPDALLLDEPTNHLDILSIRWLEKFLAAFKGTALVISHDHRFLDNICTHILDVDYQTISLYHGNYTAFEEQKVAERDRKEAEIEKRESEIARHREFVDRFRAKATKARQAQSKIKLIEKIVIEKLPPSSRRYPVFKFAQRRASGRQVLEVAALAKAFGSKQVLQGVDLTVRRGDRVAVIGPNGIGKSTLLKIAMGIVPADAGSSEWGYETWPGYFAQDHREILGASGEQSVESWLWEACPGEPIGFVRGKLAEVLFTGDDVHKPLRALSGGEGARLVFCRLSVEQPNILVLDEPTNHLDLEAIEALVEGLERYDGTLLFVSHDRWFVGELANRIVEVTPSGIRDFEGSYAEYIERCGDDHLDADVVLRQAREAERRQKAAREPKPPGSDAKRKQREKKLTAERDRTTAAIEQAEARVHAINELFCNPGYFDKTPAAEVRKVEAEQKALGGKLETLMAEWERLESELEALTSEG